MATGDRKRICRACGAPFTNAHGIRSARCKTCVNEAYKILAPRYRERKRLEKQRYTDRHRDAIRRRVADRQRQKPITPEKRKAYKTVYNATASGLLVRQPCEICGSAKAQAHHDDYSKPLEVRWLCALHHRHLHFGLL